MLLWVSRGGDREDFSWLAFLVLGWLQFCFVGFSFCCLCASMPRVRLLATMSITFSHFLSLFFPCVSYSPTLPAASSWPDEKSALGHGLSLRHVPGWIRCLAVSISLSLFRSLPRSLSMVIYLHPVYLGMLWPWFVNLPLAFCMIAWHFRCKTLNRMPLFSPLPPLYPLWRIPYTIP